MKKEQDIVFNEFISRLGEWVCVHDEELHFSDNTTPQIKLCGSTLRIRVNQKFKELPLNIQESLVAHEIGHRVMEHYAIPQDNPFYRMGFVLQGTVQKKELEADKYAAKLIGIDKYINNLSKLKEIWIKESYPYLTIKELELRLKKLEEIKND